MKMKGYRNQNISRLMSAVLLCCAVLFGASLLAQAQSYNDPRLISRAEQITGDRFSFSTRTPLGVNVFSRVRPRPEVLRAIDDGFSELFAIARRHGYRARLDHSAYTVFIARADRARDSSGAYSPDIAIPALQYAGSVYDQGGYIYAAGMVLAYNPSAFIIAEHDRDWARISNVVRYEGEHLVLYHNDRSLYQRTADHSRGGGHPILQ
jgi:hypothetical protein